MKKFIVAAITALLTLMNINTLSAQPTKPATPEDFVILSDNVQDGSRLISATPSPLVCTKQIDIKINAKTNVIEYCIFTGGCPGNLKAINTLLKGMTVDQAISKLDGINCGRRGTSCTDQLARILKKAYKK